MDAPSRHAASGRLPVGFVAAFLSFVVLSACSDDASHVGDGGSGDAGSQATVAGTITLPGAASGKPYFVRVMTAPGPNLVAEAAGTTMGSTMLSYSIADVPAGTYFLLGFVDVDSSGGTSSTTGDYRGWYGHSGDGNPPAAANVTVPASGMVTFSWALVVAPER